MTSFNFDSVVTEKDCVCKSIDKMKKSTTMLSIDDWEATCLIFADLSTQLNEAQVVRGGSSQKVTVWRGSIDLPIPVNRITFARHETSYGEGNANMHYRFWCLQESPIVRLVFEYEEVEDPLNDQGDSSSLLPVRVSVRLISGYPKTWPAQAEKFWLEWLQKKASQMLLDSDGSGNCNSYAVCAFVEHNSIVDYFDCRNVGEIFLVVLPVEENNSSPSSVFDVDSFVVALNAPHALMLHWANGGGTSSVLSRSLRDEHRRRILPAVQSKEDWLSCVCPICFDSFPLKRLVKIPSCGHLFCRDCLTSYLSVKVQDLYSHRDNPFRCPYPKCRYGMKVVGFVKQFLNADEMDTVREWYKNLKHPECWSLPQCLAPKNCGAAGTMRKVAIDSHLVFCSQCDRQWCERCLKRVTRHQQHDPLTGCDDELMVAFCRRYLKASETAKRACEKRWPWMKVYAPSRMDDVAAQAWLQETRGQLCPVCKNGVERSEGCFHIHCACGAHFCYECGEELQYPYYGTHHCWEREEPQEELNTIR